MANTKTISLAPADLQPTEMYFLLRDSIMPRPIAWVSTISAKGETNLAPFSFFNVCCPVPPVLGFSCGPRSDNHAGDWVPKDTYLNIRETGEFVINIVPELLTDQMVESSGSFPHGVSEFEKTGLVEVASNVVKPPRVQGAPVAYECKLHDMLHLGKNVWIMGDVVQVHVDPAVYQGERAGLNHRIDLLENVQTRPLGRLGRANYVRIREVDTHMRKDGNNG